MVRQQRAEDTRAAILKAAAEAFARHGYASTRLSDIVRSANVTQGALYFHFDSKAQLANELVRLQHERSIAAGEAHTPTSGSGVAAMIRLSADLARQMVSDPIVDAGLRLSTDDVEDVAEVAQAPYLDWIETCRRYLASSASAEELRAGIEVDSAAELVIAAFTGTQFLSAALAGRQDLFDRMLRMWVSLLPALVRDMEHPEIVQACNELAQLGEAKVK
ncbi:ScbR family autoregulator-binding transcription factor [Microbacterium sp. P04]|uniref:ScbR family autoregulator-binding transcription factor n=1 Tax=Microbacterium sp. P04 TaxID=3366947 RepID=UPI003746C460